MAETILNAANCLTTGNTGLFPCAISPSIYKRFFMIPKGSVIPATELADNATLLAYIAAQMKLDNSGSRWHMSGILSNLNDLTEAVKTENRDGQIYITQTPPYNFEWTMTIQFAQFAKWKQYQFSQSFYDVLYVDDAGNLIGRQAVDDTGAATIGGIPLTQFYVGDQKQATTDTLVTYKFRHNIEQNVHLNAEMAMIQAGIVPSDYQNLLIDTEIVAGVTSNTSTHIYVSAYFDGIGARKSVGAMYGTTLADPDAFAITDNGSPVTPSAVAYDATNDQWNITVSAITAAHTVKVKFAPPSVMTITPFFLDIISETAYTYTSP